MKIILASQSEVRKKILDKNNLDSIVVPSNVDEDQVKDSLLAAGANPMLISKNGAMIWNFTDQSELKMKKLSEEELKNYLEKIETNILLAYGVYQIEAGGLEIFESVKGDRDSIMGLPIKQIIDYIKTST